METILMAPPPAVLAATVVACTLLTATTYHVRLAGPALRHLAYVPGYSVHVRLGAAGSPFHQYAVWNYEAEVGTLDLAIRPGATGPAATWAARLQVGDAVQLTPPRGRLALLDGYATYYLLGSARALAYLYELHRNLRLGQQAVGFVYAATETELFADLDGSYPLPFQLMQPPRPELVCAQVRALLPPVPGHAIAYVTGDPATCLALTQLLQAWGLPAQQVRTRPCWS